jgi:carboxypeptidase T
VNKFKRLPSHLGAGLLFGLALALFAVRPADAAKLVEDDAAAFHPADTSTTPLYLLRVYAGTNAEIQELFRGGYDVLEARGKDFVYVQGDDVTIAHIRNQGFRVEIDHELKVPAWFTRDTYYGGYMTVDELQAHMDTLLSAYPNLTVGYVYGQSWVELHPQPNVPGHQLRVMCITANANTAGACSLTPSPYPNPAKPRFFLMASIHARELTTMEMARRWMDYLLQSYNVDPDVTMLLDNYELWIAPVENPDGRWQVEQGGGNPYLQRKNLNNTHGSCFIPEWGIDLNRNANWQWNHAGTSSDPCSDIYPGPSPASEPEETAIQTLLANLFPALRGINPTDPTPLDYPGVFITLHTYSDLVLFPWGCDTTECPTLGTHSPNDAQFRPFGWRMAYFLQGASVPPPSYLPTYSVGQSYEVLYAVSGNTDDYGYGALGLPGMTYEMGPGSTSGTCSGFDFFPPYECQDGDTSFPGGFWGIARPAFVYDAKNSRTPLMTALGPTALVPSPNIFYIHPGDPFTLNATVANDSFGSDPSSPSPPTVYNVSAAEYYVDTPPWAGGTPIAMTGTFGTHRVNVSGAVDTSSFLDGERHTLFFRGQGADPSSSWGAPTAVFLYVSSTFDDLSVAQAITPNPACEGSPVTITATVHNAGPDAGQNVTFTDVFPAGSTSVAASGSGWSCAVGATVVCTMPTLANGASAIVTITLNAPNPAATMTNFATVSSTTPDQNTANNNSSSTVNLNVVPASPTASNDGPVCAGGTLHLFATTVSGATYSWTGPNGFASTQQNPTIANIQPAGAGDYNVVAIKSGCSSAPATTTVVVNSSVIAVASGDATICGGQSTPLSGSGGTSCSWSPTTGLDNPLSCTPNASPASTTTYTLTVTSNGCNSINNPTVTVTVNPVPSPLITASRCLAASTSGLVASVPANPGDAYAWTLTGGTIDSGQGTESISFTSGGAGTLMSLSLVETTPNNCTGNASLTMQVDFADVPSSNPFAPFICMLARDGVTAGCGSGNFCPANNVLRSQMAVFVIRSEHYAGNPNYVPPPCTTQDFADVPCSNPFAPWIEELAHEGIAGGCATNPLLYCPTNPVTRAAMAVFLVVAEHGVGYIPPPPNGIFGDVPINNPFAPWIEELYNEGITAGCSATPLLYCPSNPVTRGQMAVFLTTTFNLP